jgi:hypothetical protein
VIVVVLPSSVEDLIYTFILLIKIITYNHLTHGHKNGVLGFWGFGVLGFWGFGVLGFWGFGVLGR